jgi:hypothetical protein
LTQNSKQSQDFPSTDYKTFEKLIFRLHWVSSNHSQSWLIPFFWIIMITFMYSYFSVKDLIETCKINSSLEICKTFSNLINIDEPFISNLINHPYIQIIIILAICISFSIILYLYFSKKNFLYSLLLALLLFFYFIYGYLTKDYNLKLFSTILNPFSIMTGTDKLTFSGLIYKGIIAYLIYQFIISIRQNTRRK